MRRMRSDCCARADIVPWATIISGLSLTSWVANSARDSLCRHSCDSRTGCCGHPSNPTAGGSSEHFDAGLYVKTILADLDQHANSARPAPAAEHGAASGHVAAPPSSVTKVRRCIAVLAPCLAFNFYHHNTKRVGRKWGRCDKVRCKNLKPANAAASAVSIMNALPCKPAPVCRGETHEQTRGHGCSVFLLSLMGVSRQHAVRPLRENAVASNLRPRTGTPRAANVIRLQIELVFHRQANSLFDSLTSVGVQNHAFPNTRL